MVKHLYRRGVFVRELADSEKYVLQDGEAMHTPMTMMDSREPPDTFVGRANIRNGHGPGAVILTDAEREQRTNLVADYDKRISERWRNSEEANQQAKTMPAVIGDARDAAHARYDAQIQNRWKGA